MKSIISSILFFSSILITAQDFRSVHQFENSYYLQNPIFNKTHVQKINPTLLKKNTSTALNKTVFGFLPWWEYNIGAHQNLRFDLLTHIAIFSFQADANGNLSDPPSYTNNNWPWKDLIDTAEAKNVKLVLTVTNSNPDDIHKLMTDDGIRARLLESILTKLTTSRFNGVVIDFENILDTDKKDGIKNFLRKMQETLNPVTHVYEIGLVTPAITGGKWFFSDIITYTDYLFIMGYDFYGSWSSTTGPSAPLTGGSNNLTNTINDDYNSIPREKLILGVPYYGNYWKTDSSKAYAHVTPYNWVSPVLRYKEIIPAYNQKEKLFDTISQTSWLRWKELGIIWNQIWFDDAISLGLKYDFAINKNLKGIGIWALGYDDGRTELWDLIEKKFTTVVSVHQNTSSIPVSFKLFQSYPNPFNPSTVISWQLEVGSYVTLKVLDILGREITTLVSEYQQPGLHNSKFMINNLSAGRQVSTLSNSVYFYRLSAGNYSETKKMILLK
jgi:spore germination protein YaaH